EVWPVLIRDHERLGNIRRPVVFFRGRPLRDPAVVMQLVVESAFAQPRHVASIEVAEGALAWIESPARPVHARGPAARGRRPGLRGYAVVLLGFRGVERPEEGVVLRLVPEVGPGDVPSIPCVPWEVTEVLGRALVALEVLQRIVEPLHQ